MLKLAFRNIFRHKGRTGLTLAAIILGVTGMILSGGFVEDIFIQLREATIHSQLGHIQVSRAGYFKVGRRDPFDYLIEDPESLKSQLRSLPRVTEVLTRMRFSGLANNGRADRPIIGEGVEPDKEARLGTFMTIVDGRQLSDNDTYGILLGEGVARVLKVDPGDFLTLLVTTPDGALNSLDFDVVGVFRTFSKDFDDRAVRIPLSTAQELMVTTGAHSLVFSLEDTEATDMVASLLKNILPQDEFDVRTWFELAEFYRKTVELYRRQFGVLQLIILVMIVLSVANSVNMAIFERTGEFGTLMALGDRKRDVFRLIMMENTLLGLIGSVLGVGIGIALAIAISSVGIPMPPPPNSNSAYTALIRLQPTLVSIAFAVGLSATILAAILPSRRASRLPLIEALRQNI